MMIKCKFLIVKIFISLNQKWSSWARANGFWSDSVGPSESLKSIVVHDVLKVRFLQISYDFLLFRNQSKNFDYKEGIC